MRKFIWAICLLFSFVSKSQPLSLQQHFKSWKPRNIGPAGMSGRIVAIDALHSNPNIIYLGAASGGVWKTTNGGAQWTPLFDEQQIGRAHV